MAKYRVNSNNQSPNRDHEVHKEGCKWWPTDNYMELGDQPSCESAVRAAKVYYSDANGCKTCSPACNKG